MLQNKISRLSNLATNTESRSHITQSFTRNNYNNLPENLRRAKIPGPSERSGERSPSQLTQSSVNVGSPIRNINFGKLRHSKTINPSLFNIDFDKRISDTKEKINNLLNQSNILVKKQTNGSVLGQENLKER